MENIIFKQKQARILLALSDKSQEWHLDSLAKAANSTYVHASRFITKCEELGLVSTERHGRIKALKLTEKGDDVTKNLSSIMEKLKPQIKVEEPKAPAT